MPSKPSPDLRAAIAADPPPAQSDKLHVIRDKAAEVRDLELKIKDLESQHQEAKRSYNQLVTVTIPELMDEVGLREIVLEAHGNLPAMRFKISSQAFAAITGKWDAARRRAAYDWLDAHGYGDLIKTQVSVAFPREERHTAVELEQSLRSQRYDVATEEMVHHRTLSAWLQEIVDSGGELPPLDVIGGFIRREVKMEKIDD